MRLLVMSGNTVANVIDVDPDAIPPEFAAAPEAPDAVGVGMVWDGTEYAPPARPPVTPDQVKAEAMRRILDIVPEWKQRNLTAQAAILAAKARSTWTKKDRDAWDAGQQLWSQVAAIRAASDRLEAMDPIPQDYRDDAHWS